MKYFFAFVLILSNNIFAQNAGHAVKLSQYVFDEFSPGILIQKPYYKHKITDINENYFLINHS